MGIRVDRGATGRKAGIVGMVEDKGGKREEKGGR